MGDSLRDQLLKSGIVKPGGRELPAAKTPATRKVRPAVVQSPRPSKAGGKAEEIGLAKAYALRAQTQDRERRQLEHAAAEQARVRRERKASIQELLAGSTLNKVGAECPRHFEYAGKIRRLYVDAEQLRALNAGQLGIVQQGGRYLLVTSALARQVQVIDPHLLALLIDPANSPQSPDGVPDDLMW